MTTHRITVLSKEGCHLCERAISTLKELSGDFVLEIIDVSKDCSLEEYLLRIPVVLKDGEIVFEAEQLALLDDCKRNLSKLACST